MSNTDEGSRKFDEYNSDDSLSFRRQAYRRERISPERYNEREIDRYGRVKRDRSPNGISPNFHFRFFQFLSSKFFLDADLGRSRSRSPAPRTSRYNERDDSYRSTSSYNNRSRQRPYGDGSSRYNQQRDNYNTRYSFLYHILNSNKSQYLYSCVFRDESNDYSRGGRRRDYRGYGENERQGVKLADPTSFDLVVSFRYFCDWKKSLNEKEPIEHEELSLEYEEYRRLALRKLFEMFFESHKNEDWFIEKYRPEVKLEREKIQTEFKKPLYSSFVENLNSGKLDSLCLNYTGTGMLIVNIHICNSIKLTLCTRLDDETSEVPDGPNSPDDLPKDADGGSSTLFIRTVPPSVSRAMLEEEFKKVDGFEYLSFSEPSYNKNFHRFGWVKFKSGTDMDAALEKLNDTKIENFVFHLSIHSENSFAQNRFAPEISSTPSRILSDLSNVRKAVLEFDNRTKDASFASSVLIKKKVEELSIKIKTDYEAKNGPIDLLKNVTQTESKILPEEDAIIGDVDKENLVGNNDDTEMVVEEAVKAVQSSSNVISDAKDVPMKDSEPESNLDENKLSVENDSQSNSQEDELQLLIDTKELDISIEYLRNVHFYCYYCCNVSDNIEDFFRKCPKHHLRRVLKDGKSSYSSGNNWARSIDTKNKAIIERPSIKDIYKQGGKLYEESSIEHFKDLIKPKDKGRFRCTVCDKLFKGDTFIRRHIINKHSSLVDSSLISSVDFFNNFVVDAPNYLPLGAGQMTNNSNNHNFNQFPGNQNAPFGSNYANFNSMSANQARHTPGNFPGMIYPYQMMMNGNPGNRPARPMMMHVPPYINSFGMGPNPMGGIQGHNRSFPGGHIPYVNPQMMGWQRPMVHTPMHGNLSINSNPVNINTGHNGLINPLMMGPASQNQMSPMNNFRQDPRSVRSYVDLDAPGDAEPDYGF
ncbi:Serrate RNA effector molecule-like protein [Smittium mucronatum]|uniref:Serrate RNA effector molecule-like protein n=1 Tax=Smittium mucronatum TaxID=133383 RepID=A0A1R0H0T8_9FUNG|nr:Serrate RNA effector molecule-like protein [Smittium mucronatum]